MTGIYTPAPSDDPRSAGRRLRLFRVYILRYSTIRQLADRLGIDEVNTVGNWERGAPYHHYVTRLCALKPGINTSWFLRGDYYGTSFELAEEIERAWESLARNGMTFPRASSLAQ